MLKARSRGRLPWGRSCAIPTHLHYNLCPYCSSSVYSEIQTTICCQPRADSSNQDPFSSTIPQFYWELSVLFLDTVVVTWGLIDALDQKEFILSCLYFFTGISTRQLNFVRGNHCSAVAIWVPRSRGQCTAGSCVPFGRHLWIYQGFQAHSWG